MAHAGQPCRDHFERTNPWIMQSGDVGPNELALIEPLLFVLIGF